MEGLKCKTVRPCVLQYESNTRFLILRSLFWRQHPRILMRRERVMVGGLLLNISCLNDIQWTQNVLVLINDIGMTDKYMSGNQVSAACSAQLLFFRFSSFFFLSYLSFFLSFFLILYKLWDHTGYVYFQLVSVSLESECFTNIFFLGTHFFLITNHCDPIHNRPEKNEFVHKQKHAHKHS